MAIFNQVWQFIIGLFGYVMEFCYTISFGKYALALLFYALFFKLLFLPFAIKQRVSANRLAAIQPALRAIEKKYAGKTDYDSMLKKQQELMALRKQSGAGSSFGGCLPLLVQIPIIYALYEIIRHPLVYISRLSGEAIVKLAEIYEVNLAGPYYEMDILTQLQGTDNAEALQLIQGATIPDISLFGINLGAAPNIMAPSLLLLVPLLVYAAQVASTYFMQLLNGHNRRDLPPEMRMSNNIMMFAMPLMPAFLSLGFSAAIGIYWIYQSLLGLLQFFLLVKLMPPKVKANPIQEVPFEPIE